MLLQRQIGVQQPAWPQPHRMPSRIAARRAGVPASRIHSQPAAAPATLDGPSTSQSPQEFLATHLLSHQSFSNLQKAGSTAVVLAAAAVLCMLPVDPAQASDTQHIHHMASVQFDLAEDTDFWANVARYGRYFVTVMLGTGYVMVKPLVNAFKNPVSAILALSAVVALVFGIKVTLELMLGLTVVDYPIDQ